MVYSSRFSDEVKRRLEGLKQAIDRDLVTLEGTAPNISFAQADEILAGTQSVLSSYQSAMRPLYSVTGKPSYGSRPAGPRRSSSEGPRGKMEPAALETIQQQGYLIDKEFVAKYSFNRNAVSRKLQELAQQYNWRRERTDGGWRYVPERPASSEPAPAASTDVSPPGEPPTAPTPDAQVTGSLAMPPTEEAHAQVDDASSRSDQPTSTSPRRSKKR